MNVIFLSKRLKELDEIATNPNAKNGIWNSFSLFISISDEILKSIKDSNGNLVPQAASESLIKDLQSIRPEFEKISGIKLEEKCLGAKFDRIKNNVAKSHKFKSLIAKFLERYQGHFLVSTIKMGLYHIFFLKTFHKILLKNIEFIQNIIIL